MNTRHRSGPPAALPASGSRPGRRRRHRAVLGVVTVVMLLLSAVGAEAHGPDPILSDRLFGQDQHVAFHWRAGAEPPAAIKTAIKDAAAGLNASRASRAATFGYAAGGSGVIGYGVGATCGVNGIACFTRNAPESYTMWLREHGRVFDWGTLKWCQMSADPPNGCYDVQTIALDEFGHIEVLGHHANFADDSDYLDAVVQTVSRTKPKVGWDEHILGRCDVATLQREYDVPNTATPISTCLSLSTVATLAAGGTAVAAGTTVSFSATLRVADTDAYDRLADNALSGRTVKLQRRALGTTTWSTVATMAPGVTAGTYTATYKITANGEFRSLFSATAAEGLSSDGSPVVTVRLVSCTAAPVGGRATRAPAAPCAEAGR